MHVLFADVFRTMLDGKNAQGGFDCMLGNPPWERVKLQEKEFFAQRAPEIANAANAAARKRAIERLSESDPGLLAEFAEAQRQAEGESHLMRSSGVYPLCGRGDINVYTIFAELGRCRLAFRGLMGFVLPSGIATLPKYPRAGHPAPAVTCDQFSSAFTDGIMITRRIIPSIAVFR